MGSAPGEAGGRVRPTWGPALRVSAALHLAALAWTAWRPRRWRPAAAVLLADHLVLTGAGLLPRCRVLGPNLRRLGAGAVARGEIALTFDDGPDPEVTPRVLDLLADAGAVATFFCVGRLVERHRGLAAEIAGRGHRVENHTWSHPHSFALRGPSAMARQIDRAQAVIAEVVGRAPRLFRPPAGIRNPFLEPLLARRGLHLASWTRRGYDAVDPDAGRVARRLETGLAAGDVLLLHDGGGRAVALDVLPRVLGALRRRGLGTAVLRFPTARPEAA